MFPPLDPKMVYVYKLPKDLSNGYCFGPGVPVTFINVDWFTADPNVTREDLQSFISKKRYIGPGETFLVCSPELDISFTFKGE